MPWHYVQRSIGNIDVYIQHPCYFILSERENRRAMRVLNNMDSDTHKTSCWLHFGPQKRLARPFGRLHPFLGERDPPLSP